MMVLNEDFAVKLRNVTFSYGRKHSSTKVLDNVSVSVAYGVIYALLGPSGCGKTTLLKVATGNISSEVQRGQVQVFGQNPMARHSLIPGPGLGYMPQELALHNYISVKETLWLFGKLNLLKTSHLEYRIKTLRNILHLPPDHVCVDNLSCGQKRRVSLAIALLHNPPLLVLDEPTVGVDPLLRREIWSHLVHLAITQNTTIIMTTHYIEEAKDANIISAMRNGRILEEATPKALMNSFGGSNLEKCFFNLFYQDSTTTEKHHQMQTETGLTNTLNSGIARGDATVGLIKRHHVKTYSAHFLQRILVLCGRNLILFKRNKPELIFQILTPIVTLLFYCVCVGSRLHDIPISVVNEDCNIGHSNLGETFVQHLDRSRLSVTVASFRDAYVSVKNGNSWAFLHIGKNFTDCLKEKLQQRLNVDEITLNCSTVSCYFDFSNQQIYYTLLHSFLKSYQSFYEELLDSIYKTRMVARFPLDMSSTIYGSHDTNAGDAMIPGILMLLISALSAGLAVFKQLNERNSGALERIQMCGASKSDTLFSTYATEMLKIITGAISMMVFIFYIFKVPQEGSVVLLAILTISQGLQGTAFGIFLSSVSDSSTAGIFATSGYMTLNFIACGVMWPLEASPAVVKKMAYFLPMTLPNLAFKAIMFKGMGLESSVVWLGFVSTLAWFLVYMALSLLIMKHLR